VDGEQGTPRPHRHPPHPPDFRAFAPLPHVAPERPSAISSSARDELRSPAFRICERSSSAEAMRTTMPSARCQYAPSGPARTNSKSRNPYGLAKFSFARLISFASRLLSCVFRAGKKQNPAPSCFGCRVFRSGEKRFVYECSPFGNTRPSIPLPASDGMPIRSTATPHSCEYRRGARGRFVSVVCVMRSRLLSSCPLVREMRTTKGNSPRRRGRKQSEGEKSETNLPTVPPAHLAECLPVG